MSARDRLDGRARGRAAAAVPALLGVLAGVLIAVMVAVGLPLAAGRPVAVAASGSTVPGAAVAVAPRRLTVLPGFRVTPSGPVLDTARFTTVAVLGVPASGAARAVVLTATVRVAVPIRVAMSVRGWCDPRRSAATPGAASLRDVLVIGQNPVPGRSAQQVASRTLTGRAVVQVPAGGARWCVLQVSPRTEATTGSTMQLLGGRFSTAPLTLLGRAAQRPALLVGSAGAGGWPSSAGAPVRVRNVAVIGPLAVAGPVRIEGEAELTTCALGYHLCGRGRSPSSVIDVRLVVRDVAAGGATCKVWRGTARRVVITPAVHHVKVIAPGAGIPARCGTTVQGYLEVVHVSGNAAEIEPTLVPPGAVLVQTHTWLARP
jgi:hypothetical protein